MGATDEPLTIGARTRIQRLAERQATDGAMLHRILDTAGAGRLRARGLEEMEIHLVPVLLG